MKTEMAFISLKISQNEIKYNTEREMKKKTRIYGKYFHSEEIAHKRIRLYSSEMICEREQLLQFILNFLIKSFASTYIMFMRHHKLP